MHIYIIYTIYADQGQILWVDFRGDFYTGGELYSGGKTIQFSIC